MNRQAFSTYSESDARDIMHAYDSGRINTSLDLLADSTLQRILPANRHTVTNTYHKQSLEQANMYPHGKWHALIAVGGMAVGKTTYIQSLDTAEYFKPSGYARHLPEYAAFESFGTVLASHRNTQIGPVLADHASLFIRQERIRLKRQALAAVAAYGCPIALECHPWPEEVTELIDEAQSHGYETTILGIRADPTWDPAGKALQRACISGRHVPLEYLALTHTAMETNWETIASLSATVRLITTDQLQ